MRAHPLFRLRLEHVARTVRGTRAFGRTRRHGGAGRPCAAFSQAGLPRPLGLDWYKEHVLRGARELGLPAQYVAAIERIAADIDADEQRRRRERAIHH